MSRKTRRRVLYATAACLFIGASTFIAVPGLRAVFRGDPSGWIGAVVGLFVALGALFLFWRGTLLKDPEG